MARKKSREEGEEREFGPPPFDEKRFYRTELEAAKATIIAALWGIGIAAVSAALFALTGDFTIGAAAGVLAVFFIKPLLDLFKVSYEGWDWTKAAALLVSFFFCWLAFWVLLSNPPVMDLAPPVLSDSTEAKQELGGTIKLAILASDNSGVASISAVILGPGGIYERLTNFTEESGGLYMLPLTYTSTGNYTYEIRAEDSTGRSSKLKGSFELVPSQPPVIELIAPDNGTNITYEQAIMLHIYDNARVSEVYYILDGSPEKIFLKMEKRGYQSYSKDIYRIRTNLPGQSWSGGTHSIVVVATDAAGNTTEASYTFTIR
ncbi:MAG: hypothetical protein QXW06_07905 [Thermoplasmata archaeon]